NMISLNEYVQHNQKMQGIIREIADDCSYLLYGNFLESAGASGGTSENGYTFWEPTYCESDNDCPTGESCVEDWRECYKIGPCNGSGMTVEGDGPNGEDICYPCNSLWAIWGTTQRECEACGREMIPDPDDENAPQICGWTSCPNNYWLDEEYGECVSCNLNGSIPIDDFPNNIETACSNRTTITEDGEKLSVLNSCTSGYVMTSNGCESCEDFFASLDEFPNCLAACSNHERVMSPFGEEFCAPKCNNGYERDMETGMCVSCNGSCCPSGTVRMGENCHADCSAYSGTDSNYEGGSVPAKPACKCPDGMIWDNSTSSCMCSGACLMSKYNGYVPCSSPEALIEVPENSDCETVCDNRKLVGIGEFSDPYCIIKCDTGSVLNRNGECVSCDESSGVSIRMYGIFGSYCADQCSNRELIAGRNYDAGTTNYCTLKCDGVRDYDQESCHSCDSPTNYTPLRTSECSSKCPGLLFGGSAQSCYSCSTGTSVTATATECASCGNLRTMIDSKCAIANCGGGSFRNLNSDCISCSSTTSYTATPGECAKCGDTREMIGDKCYLACTKGQFRFGNFCFDCSDGNTYSTTAEECGQCAGTNSPRFMNNGRCYPCSVSYTVSSSTAEECAACGNLRSYDAAKHWCKKT
ncbi:MAG: hypothetical protein IKQ99_02255, partial [Alphaproteobacteria bacterium]|nr:hypothetical protein [Alphaproteobacteria bacterium]